MTAGAEQAAGPQARLFAAWERAVGELIASAARDPRTLALGAAALRAGLLAARAGQLAWRAWATPWTAFAPPAREVI